MTPAERVRVHATAWAILGDAHLADDVTQDVALRLDRDGLGWSAEERRSWIARQAVGLARNRRRGELRRVRNEREAGLPRARRRGHAPERGLEQAEDLDQVRAALARLEERQRLPVVLRFFHDRRLAEIASILGVPVSTAHERLQRGLSTLRGHLRRTDVAPALIGLALPRATAVLAPAAVVARASVLASGGFWLARAAVLLAAATLGSHAPDVQVQVDPELAVARAAEPQVRTPRFPQPPPAQERQDRGGSEPEGGRGGPGPLQPPHRGGDSTVPDAGEEGLEPEGSPGQELGAARPFRPLPFASGSATRAPRPGSPVHPAVPRTSPGDPDQASGEGGRGGGGGVLSNSTSPGRGGGEGDGGGGLGASGAVWAGSGGDDKGDGDDDGGPGVASLVASGTPLLGRVEVDGSGEAGLWVLAQDPDAEDGPPLASAVTGTDGRFELLLDPAVEALIVVAVPDGEGALHRLPLRASDLGPDGGLRLDVE